MAEDLRLLLKAREGEPVVFSYPSKVTPEVVLRTKMKHRVGDSECRFACWRCGVRAI